MTEKEIQELAENRVGFKRHSVAFLFVMPFLFIIDYVTTGRITWAYWPLIGWGLGLGSHWMTAYGPIMFSVEDEADRIRRKVKRH